MTDGPLSLLARLGSVLKGRQVAVTGADGFIGRQLCRGLAAGGLDVAAYGRDWDVRTDSIDLVGGLVFHLAALTDVRASWLDPYDFIAVNLMGTTRLLEQARREQAAIVLATTYPYGKPRRLPVDELHPLDVVSPYHLSKVEAERIGFFFAQHYDLSVVSARLFNIYGPGMPSRFAIGNIVEQALCPSVDRMVLDGCDVRRDLVYVDDAVDALIACATTVLSDRSSSGTAYNIATGRAWALSEVAKLALQLVGRPDVPVTFTKRAVPGNIDEIYGDSSKLCSAAGWSPQHGLEVGMRSTLAGAI